MEKHIHNSCQVVCKCDTDVEYGTGFLISPTQIVTAAHVLLCPIGEEAQISVKFSRADGPHEYRAKSAQCDASPLAILTIENAVDYIPTTYHAHLPNKDECADAYGFPKSIPSGYSVSFAVNHQVLDKS